MKSNAASVVVAGLSAAMAPMMAGAQDAASPGEESTVIRVAQAGDGETSNAADLVIQELVITATRRETTVQTTPLAITALGGDSLTNMGATSMQDVFALVPGLKVGQATSGGGRITLRGIQASGEATVGLYYDETPLTGPSGTSQNSGGRSQDANLYDVERIEVLRGPQGTLYGSGSMGGTVRLIFNKADTRSYAGSAEAQYTSMSDGDPGYYAKGMANVPLVDGMLGARVVVFHEERGGYIDNVRYGVDNVNEVKSSGGRLMLTWLPADNITWHGMAMVQETEAGGPGSWYPLLGARDYSTDRAVHTPGSDDLYLFSSDFDWNLSAASLSWSSSFYRWNILNTSDYTNTMVTNAANRNNCRNYFSGALGIPTTSCTDAQFAQFQEFASSRIPASLYQPQVVETWTHEVRLASPDDDSKLDWTIGAYLEERSDAVDSIVGGVDKVSGAIFEPVQLWFHRDIFTDTKQTAFFADISYEPIERFVLNFGARRYDYEKTTYGQTDIPNWVTGSLVEPWRSVSADASGWLMKYNASYRFQQPMMVYATASQGFRPGGANNTPNLEAALVPYGPDSVWNYEVGLKTSWLANRLTLNTAIYQINWEDIQTSAQTLSGCCNFILNAGQARIRGIELEAGGRPLPGLNLTASVTFSDPVLLEDQINANIRDSTSLGDKGDQIPDVSKFSASATGEYVWTLVGALDAMLRLDYSYTGKSYSHFRPTNANYEKQGGFGLVNLRAGVQKDSWGAYLFVRNALDVVGAYSVSSSAGSEQLSNTTLPRTYGFNVRKTFN